MTSEGLELSNIPDIRYTSAYSRSIRLHVHHIANGTSQFASSLSTTSLSVAVHREHTDSCLIWVRVSCADVGSCQTDRSSTRLVLHCSAEVADKRISTPNDQLPLLCNRNYAGRNLWAAMAATTQVHRGRVLGGEGGRKKSVCLPGTLHTGTYYMQTLSYRC